MGLVGIANVCSDLLLLPLRWLGMPRLWHERCWILLPSTASSSVYCSFFPYVHVRTVLVYAVVGNWRRTLEVGYRLSPLVGSVVSMAQGPLVRHWHISFVVVGYVVDMAVLSAGTVAGAVLLLSLPLTPGSWPIVPLQCPVVPEHWHWLPFRFAISLLQWFPSYCCCWLYW